jgi:transposase-like protein
LEQQEEGQIGGPGVEVQIDESKIGKRKYNRGRMVDGSWILGMLEIIPIEQRFRNNNNGRAGGRFRLEICPENKRDAATLIPLIKKHVAKNSIIISDKWGAYARLEEEGYYHKTVNHSENFVDPVTAADTQAVESHWRDMKRAVRKGGIRKSRLGLHLSEYLWRRQVAHSGEDPFNRFLKATARVFNPADFEWRKTEKATKLSSSVADEEVSDDEDDFDHELNLAEGDGDYACIMDEIIVGEFKAIVVA